MSEVEARPAERSAIKLATFPRWALGLLGAAGMGGGSLAVFTQDVEAGPVAMIGIGAFFFLMGVVGLMPTRLKVGDSEAEWSAVQEFVEQTVEDVPSADRLALFRRLNELNRALPEAASPALSSMLYEESIFEMVREIAHDLRPQLETETQRSGRPGFDMLVTGPTGRKVALEIRASERPIHSYVNVYRRFKDRKDQLGLEHLMIITAHRPSNRIKQHLADLDDVSLVPVAGEEDMPFLRQAIIRRTGASEA